MEGGGEEEGDEILASLSVLSCACVPLSPLVECSVEKVAVDKLHCTVLCRSIEELFDSQKNEY